MQQRARTYTHTQSTFIPFTNSAYTVKWYYIITGETVIMEFYTKVKRPLVYIVVCMQLPVLLHSSCIPYNVAELLALTIFCGDFLVHIPFKSHKNETQERS